MPPSAAELKAVVKALEDEYPEGSTSKDVALRVIDALDVVREKSDQWITVARIKLPGGEYHNYAIGPFTTVKKAQTAGESFMPNTMAYKRDGDAAFRVVPLVSNDKQAWEAIRPEQVDHQAYIKESVKQWSPSAWIDLLKEKQGWGHKPQPSVDLVNKVEEHA